MIDWEEQAEAEFQRIMREPFHPEGVGAVATPGVGVKCETLADMSPEKRAEMERLYGPIAPVKKLDLSRNDRSKKVGKT